MALDMSTSGSPRRVSLREEQKHLTRGRLLDAAVTVFTENSVIDATMEDIARVAGVTRVTVYAHFPGKGEIIRALEGRVYDLMGEVFADLAATPRWTRTTIRDWLQNAAARWQAMAPIFRAVAAAASTAALDTSTSRDRYLGAHERYVAVLTAQPERWRNVSAAQARDRALMVVLQTGALFTAWLVAGLPMASEDPLDLLTDAVCHLLGPALHKEQRRRS